MAKKPAAAKDDAIVSAPKSVKYEVLKTVYVNDTIMEPGTDGHPVYVVAKPGLKGTALRPVDDDAKDEADEKASA